MGFRGQLFFEDKMMRMRRTLRGVCSEDRRELQVKSKLDFTVDPDPAPESDWVDWSWGWKKEDAR
jgi:hypothetical protein